jgi:hypothetical protein
MASSKQQADDQAAFADEFNADDKQKPEQSEDEAFGLGPEAGDGTGADGAAADAGGDAGAGEGADTGAGAGADAAAAPAAGKDDAAAKEKELSEREAALAAKEAELDQRAASMATSNANETQTSTGEDDGKDGDDGGEVGAEGAGSARAALTEDFGPEFVNQLEAFIKEVAAGSVSGEIGTLASTVQSVIDNLQTERNQQHFQTIADAHDDFMEVVASPAFKEWLDGHPEAEKADYQRVVDSGSAKEIIAMLTQFKTSKEATDAPAINDDELDNAEGVRSSGLRLPSEPKESQDYAAAWNEA